MNRGEFKLEIYILTIFCYLKIDISKNYIRKKSQIIKDYKYYQTNNINIRF